MVPGAYPAGGAEISWVDSGITHKHLTRLERPARNKHSSLLGPFVSYKGNKVLCIWQYCL
jgi:hypothetical protein